MRGRETRRLSLETLETRRVMTTPPFGAMPQDTGEFMLGRVAVTPVFLESNGKLDPRTEDCTPSLIQSTLQKVEAGVNWWGDTLATLHTVHTLEFTFDTTYADHPAATRYEPISRVSNDFALWVQEFVAGAGFDTPGGLDADIRAFNDAQRQKMNADWAYTMFIVNSNHDADGSFAPGGSFSQAFAFAGGLFLVAPSTRPASTFAHETGHMFWAKDEYAGGASWTEHRGYYNTQNLNAADNSEPGFVQQPSIMASGSLLDYAYDHHVSPASTLAMVGWQDSDGDGIFDVLDVPLKLTGTGYYDSAAAAYKFRGAAKVGVLPNLNPDGLHNDITLNRITAIQYRTDGGNWTTVSNPDAYETPVDLSIPLSGSAQTVEIRAI
ncbi:MAG: dockerin type I domain-containing protein, partial [Aureliella sp.]